MDLTVLVFLLAVKKFQKLGGEAELLKALPHAASREFRIVKMDYADVTGPDEEDYASNFLRACRAKSFGSFRSIQYILIHKLSDFSRHLATLGEDGDVMQRRLEEWLGRMIRDPASLVPLNTTIRVFNDRLGSIALLSDRNRTGRLVRALCNDRGYAATGIQWPAFYECTEESFDKLKFPVIVKLNDACSKVDSHLMRIISLERPEDEANVPVTPELLASTTSASTGSPWHIVQQFYPHHGVLFKVYVLGEDCIEIVMRPSIKLPSMQEGSQEDSVSYGNGTSLRQILFHTHQFKTDHKALPASLAQHYLETLFNPHRELITAFTKDLARELGLLTFGIDVIIPEEGAGIKVAVIDVNFFPGYDGVEQLPCKLMSCLRLDAA